MKPASTESPGMKVLFVSFQENSDVIGVKYLHAYLRSKGYDSTILLVPNERRDTFEGAIAFIVERAPGVLCFSAMSYEFGRATAFARALAERFEGRPRVFGGIHASADPESCLAVADIVVRGEGEDTLLELLQTLEQGQPDGLAHVAGVVFKEEGETRYTAVRQPVEAVDSLPYPRHLPEGMYVSHRGAVLPITDPVAYKTYARYQGTFLSILSSRGCPFACHYCSNSLFRSLYGEHRVRNRSPEQVVDEIALEVGEFGNILYVNFQDDCFMMHPMDWIEQFAKLYREQVGVPFIVRTTPKHIKRDKLVALKQAGLRWVFMGLQTGSDRINLEVYGRRVSAEEFIEAATVVSELHLSPWYDVILDNPYETDADHLLTIELLLRAPRPFQLDLFSLDYFPGTELRRRALADGIAVPEVGEKSYTEPEPKPINRLIRMSATLPSWVVRPLARVRHRALGAVAIRAFYALSLGVEPFVYLWLVFRANDFRILRTLKVVRAFYSTAIGKLFFRQQG